MCYRILSASALMLLMTGCATRDAQVSAPWQIEPVFNVRHAFQTSQAYYTLGRYHDGAQAWVKAVEAYRKAIAADAHHIEAYNALGVALAHMGQYADSETTLRQAVALAPALAHVRSNLGYVLLLAGKPQDAATELQAAVRQDRSDAIAAANLREALAKVQAQARDALAGGAQIAAATPAQPAAVTSAAPIEATPITPMAVLAAAAVPEPAAASAGGQGHLTSLVVAMPVPALRLSATTAALRVFDQPSVASLQGIGTIRADATRASASTTAARPAGMGPDAGPSAMTQVAFEPAVGATAAVAASAVTKEVATKEAARVAMAPALMQATAVNASPKARLELSNGNGITGMAANVRRWLSTQGFSVARLTNQRPYTQQQTLVQYRSGYEQAAQRVARTLPASARLEVARDLQSDVRVVLGRDSMQYADCLALQNCQARAAALALATY